MMENELIKKCGETKTCKKNLKNLFWFKFSWCTCMGFATITSLDYDQLSHINAVKQAHVK